MASTVGDSRGSLPVQERADELCAFARCCALPTSGLQFLCRWEEFEAERSHLLGLKERGDGGDGDAERAYLK
eukprot:1847872-Pleurochrysis_carterae.AAC.2